MTAPADDAASPARLPGRRAGAAGAGIGSLARGGSLGLIGAAASALLNVALVVLVTRSFATADAGVFFSATSIFLVTYAVARLGTGLGLVYFISRVRALGQRERIGAYLRTALRPVATFASLLGVTLFLTAPWLADAAGFDNASSVAVLRVLAVFIPLAALSDVVLAATRGFQTMRPLVTVEKVSRPLAQLVFVAVLVLAGSRSSTLLALGWAVPYLGTALLGFAWLRRLRYRDGVAEGRVTTPPGLRREFWRFTAPRSVAGVAQVALQRLDIVLVAALLGPAEAAVYTAATRFLVVGQLGTGAISTAVQARLSALLARGEHEAATTVYQVSTCWLVAITWPLYLLSAVFSSYVLAIFGRGYTAGAGVMVVLALTMLVATATGLVDVVLAMAGRTTWNLGTALLALSVNVTVNVLLIPRIGILGAAVAWAAAILAGNVVALTLIRVSLKMHPYGRGTWTAMALAAGCFGVLPMMVRLLAGPGAAPLLVAAGIGAAVYLLALWRLRRVLALDALGGFRRPARSAGRTAPADDSSRPPEPAGAAPSGDLQ